MVGLFFDFGVKSVEDVPKVASKRAIEGCGSATTLARLVTQGEPTSRQECPGNFYRTGIICMDILVMPRARFAVEYCDSVLGKRTSNPSLPHHLHTSEYSNSGT